MLNFKYRYCKTRMVAFLNNELPPRARRRVGRYIDECPRCYQEYITQREIQRQLQADLPLIGQVETARLSGIWYAIEQEIHTPPRRVLHRGRFRYGLVMVALVLVLLLPMMVGADPGARMDVTPATPGQKVSAAATDIATTDDTVRPHATMRVDSTDDTNKVLPEAARTPDANS